MQLTQSTSMRMEQRQLLTPRMIQSMEILQLPQMALEERIEQELQNNPVLELREGDADAEGEPVAVADQADVKEAREDFSESEQPMVVTETTDQADSFERLEKLGEYMENEEYNVAGSNLRQSHYVGGRDKRLDAM